MKYIFAVVALVFLWGLSQCDSQTSEAKPFPRLLLLPGVRDFLERHSEFGKPIRTQSIPDWAQGKRQRVQFSNGRNLLFYLKEGLLLRSGKIAPKKDARKYGGLMPRLQKTPLKISTEVRRTLSPPTRSFKA